MTKSLTVEQLRCLELARIIREGLPGVRFSMSQFRNDCGTAGCIAGHAVAAYAPKSWFYGEKKVEISCTVPALAGKLLGLDRRQGRDLFIPDNISWHDITPAMAAATLENFAMTGRVEWP